MSDHKVVPLGERHPPIQFEYVDEAARLAATGFIIDDIGQFARQLDDNSVWMLVALTPVWIGSLDFDNPHWFAGVQFFDDDTGMTKVNAGDGTVVLTVETINNEGSFEPASDGTIQANSKHTVSWAANTRGVRFTPTVVTIATHYRGIVTSNRT